jgi:hypothetical protein
MNRQTQKETCYTKYPLNSFRTSLQRFKSSLGHARYDTYNNQLIYNQSHYWLLETKCDCLELDLVWRAFNHIGWPPSPWLQNTHHPKMKIYAILLACWTFKSSFFQSDCYENITMLLRAVFIRNSVVST